MYQVHLAYNREHKRFWLLEASIAAGRCGVTENYSFRDYGLYEMESIHEFPGFSPSQLVDALNWCNARGTRTAEGKNY